MPWQKKAAAADYVNLAEMVETLITGGPDAWMLSWWELVDSRVIDVNAMCSAGPEECEAFNAIDFLGFVRTGAVGAAIQTLGLSSKINCFARQRLFAALCEFSTPATGVWVLIGDHVTQVPGYAFFNPPVNEFELPPGVNILRLRHYAGSADGNFHIEGHSAAGANINDWTVGATNPDGTGTVEGWSYWQQSGPLAVRIGPWSASGGQDVGFWYWSPGGGSGEPGSAYVPPPLAQPASAIPPAAGVYPDIAALGVELDRQERKLEWILNGTVQQTIADIGQLVAVGGWVAVDNGLQVILEDDTVGVSIAVTSVASDVDEAFGNPPRFYGLGRVLFGNAFGWQRPVDLVVSPMLIYPLPPGTDRLRVHINGGSTAAVQRLALAQPLG